MKGKDVLGLTLLHEKDYGLKTYDFKRPDKFSRDQIRTVSIMHETFARLSSSRLSAMLRSLVHIHVVSVDQMTYEEFIRAAPNPAPFVVVTLSPLKGTAVLQMDPGIAFPMIERIFGGPGTLQLNREFTIFEALVFEGLILRSLDSLKESWQAVVPLTPGIDHVECNPLFVQIVPPTEMIILVTFEVRMGGISGLMNFCIPYLTIEPIIAKLSARYWYSQVRPRNSMVTQAKAGRIKTGTEVVIRGEKISLSGLKQLKKNSLIRLPEWKDKTCWLYSGRDVLLELKRVMEGREKIYQVVDREEPKADWELPAVMPGEKEYAYLERITESIQVPLREMKKEMHHTLENIGRSLRELRQKQEQLENHLDISGQEPVTGGHGEIHRYGARPFLFIKPDDVDHLYTILQVQHPQLIALILCYLEPGMASSLLVKFSDELQIEVVRRIASMDRIAPEVMREIEHFFETRLKEMSSMKVMSGGGVQQVTDILNTSSRSLEKKIIEALEKKDPEMAENIKFRMFVFEDIPLLDKKIMKKLLRKVNRNDLLLAMKAVEQKIGDHFLEAMEKKEREQFLEDLEGLGRVRLSKVEEAQQKIVFMLKEMDESGEVEIGREEEMI